MASTRILATGKIDRGGEVDWHIAPLPEDEEIDNPCRYPDYPLDHNDGELQRLIDEGEQTAEYEDYLADVEWMRRGM